MGRQQRLEEFNKKHVVARLPEGSTFGIETCTCGARWRVWYSPRGLEKVPLCREAVEHDRELYAIMQDRS